MPRRFVAGLGLALGLAVSSHGATVLTSANQTLEGTISFNASGLSVKTKDAKQKLAPGTWTLIENAKAVAPTLPDQAWIQLSDGSTLVGQLVSRDIKGAWTIKRPDGASLNLGSDRIKRITLLPLPIKPETLKRTKDTTAVMINGREYIGKIQYATPLLFGFATERGRERLSKKTVAHFVFPTATKAAAYKHIVYTAAGDRLQGTIVKMDDKVTHVRTKDTALNVPTSWVRRVEAKQSALEPLLAMQPKITTRPYLDVIHPPQFQTDMFGNPVVLFNALENDVISLHSFTELRYNLAKKYATLIAYAAIDTRYSKVGTAELRVEVDGKVAFKHTLVAGEAPVPVNVSLAKRHRMRIIMDYGEKGSSGDYGMLIYPRLAKAQAAAPADTKPTP